MTPTDSPLHDRLVFLVGARRSGTNWLQRILRAHPGVVGLPTETYVFNMGIKPLAERFQHANPGSLMMATMFSERATFVSGVRELLDRAILDNLERLDPDARFVVERTPWHVYDLELIAEIYPDARAIHIIRDGRAVARSLLAKDWGPDTMDEAAEEWRSSVEAGRTGGKAFGERYREVRYEELLANPGDGIDDVFAWLGLELDAEERERILLEAASEFNVDPGSPGISPDKWSESLSPRDLATFERVAGAQLRALGYPTGAIGTPSAREAVEARLRPAVAAARRLRHPRAAVNGALERSFARRALQTLESNYAVVERFEKAVERGREGEALALLAPKVRARIGAGEDMREQRGEEAGRAVLEAFAEHEPEGARQLWGQVHSNPNMFTLLSAYELPDGSRWTRVLVLNVTDAGLINDLTLYRFPLGAGADLPAAAATADA